MLNLIKLRFIIYSVGNLIGCKKYLIWDFMKDNLGNINRFR